MGIEPKTIINTDTQFGHLVAMMLHADGETTQEELAMLESMQQREEDALYMGVPVLDLERHQQSLIIQDLCLLAACDGHFHSSERVLLEAICTELECDERSIQEFVRITHEMSQLVEFDPTRVYTALEQVRLDVPAEPTMEAAVRDAVAIGAATAAHFVVAKAASNVIETTLGEDVEAIIPSKAIVGLASDPRNLSLRAAATSMAKAAGTSVTKEVINESAGEALSELAPVGGAMRAIHSATQRDFKAAAGHLAQSTLSSGAKAIAGGAATSVAGSFAYAGVSGSLLKVGVTLGICSAPLTVTAAPVVAGAAAAGTVAVGAHMVRKRLNKKPKPA